VDKRKQKRLIRSAVTLGLVLALGFLQSRGIIQINSKPVQKAVSENTPGTYAVEKFDDGDTIVVDMSGKKETIRFIGVDTPEVHDPRKPIQCFGKAASAHTKQLIGENRVRLEADPTNSNRDRYNRLLRYVYLPDGTLVNKKIIADGYGFALTAFPFEKMEEFRQAQKEAREGNRGLWSACKLDTSSGHNQTKPE
jgi:endonuclease YncB( thermonuclease family)